MLVEVIVLLLQGGPRQLGPLGLVAHVEIGVPRHHRLAVPFQLESFELVLISLF